MSSVKLFAMQDSQLPGQSNTTDSTDPNVNHINALSFAIKNLTGEVLNDGKRQAECPSLSMLIR